MKSFHDGRVNLWDGDCREVMAGFEPDSFDACVCDPPYHLTSISKPRKDLDNYDNGKGNPFARRQAGMKGFMGKRWDGGQIAHEPETWAAVLRVLKPGAHLVAFHAPKNWHRLALAIEEAGLEIRDNLLWLFGSGFPKSHDVSKAIDRALGAKREIVGYSQGRSGAIHGGGQSVGIPDAITRASSELAAQWAGFGSSLKPAYEPIVLARKPLSESTIAANVMEHGTGAINIDACRVAGTPEPTRFNPAKHDHDGYRMNATGAECAERASPLGRWPANLIHDGSKEVVEGFPESNSGSGSTAGSGTSEIYGEFERKTRGAPIGKGDSGSAARFFATFPQEQQRFWYGSKADSGDRLASRHPTVKPIALLQWLCRLITPPQGRILDCFAGTGTTAEAALREGFRCTLIEREPEYLADIERRMALVFEGETSRSVAMAKLQDEGDALPLFAEAAE